MSKRLLYCVSLAGLPYPCLGIDVPTQQQQQQQQQSMAKFQTLVT
jgi:hypothetical protein